MKLKNLFKINKNALKDNHEDLSQSFRILRSCISKMFPNEHRLSKSMVLKLKTILRLKILVLM